MSNAAARVRGGFLALVAIWIGVYWLWEPTRSAGVSFSDDSTREGSPLLGREAQDLASPPPEKISDISTTPEPMSVDLVLPDVDASVTPPEFREYTIRRGDTFESIARQFFGTIRRADAVAKANPFVSPTRLRAGQVIRVPIDPDNVQGEYAQGDEPELPSPEFIEYIVVRGDTLSEIAQHFYGSLRYAKVIFNANRSTMRNQDDLSIGDTLRIPSRESVLGDTGDR